MLRSPIAVALLVMCAGVFGQSAPQHYVISTIAGGAPPQTPAPGTQLQIDPISVAADSAGDAFFVSRDCLYKLDLNGVVKRIAGTSTSGFSGDGGPATSAQLNSPAGISVDSAGNIFIADSGNQRIRKVSAAGIITTVAGVGLAGGNPFPGMGGPNGNGDGGPAVDAEVSFPQDVAVDSAGNLYIAEESTDRVRKVSPAGIITTVAGGALGAAASPGGFGSPAGYSGDGGPATAAQLNTPFGVAVDGAGNIFIADYNNERVRKVSPDGTITTVAGNGSTGFNGFSGAATSLSLDAPSAVATDSAGNLYIADFGNALVRKVTPDGMMPTVAKDATSFGVSGVSVDGAGNLFIAFHPQLDKVSPSGIVTTAAGNGQCCYAGDGGNAAAAQLSGSAGVAIDTKGNLYIADVDNGRIRAVSPSGMITTLLAGANESNVALDPGGNVYYNTPLQIWKVTPAGPIVIAGTLEYGYGGDGGLATAAQFNTIGSLEFDHNGNLYVADSGNNRIRKISGGIVTTVAGTGVAGYSGDGGPATSAQLSFPYGVAVDGNGDIYIADTLNHRIRKVSPDGTISTIAGTDAPSGVESGGPATSAHVLPGSIVVDTAGNLYFSDGGTAQIREISTTGIITTIAGNGSAGDSGDGGPALGARLAADGIAIDATGNVYVADPLDNAVRRLTPVSGADIVISSVIDAASEGALPVSPGKIIVIYGVGLGPDQLAEAQPSGGVIGTQLAGTTVQVNGIPAPILYTSATQVGAIVPYAVANVPTLTAYVAVSYGSLVSLPFPAFLSETAPSIFSLNQTGAGQAAAVNVDGTYALNDAAHPIRAGNYVELFLTGEGQTSPAGVDGKLATFPLPQPLLPVSVTVGGMPATFNYAGGVSGIVAGLMQLNVLIPPDVQPGGYVPVIVKVGDGMTGEGVSIAVSAN